jgi:hypothetical protein
VNIRPPKEARMAYSTILKRVGDYRPIAESGIVDDCAADVALKRRPTCIVVITWAFSSS